MMLSPNASFDLARQLQSPAGAPLGEVFAFVSGLYFRGKLAYARRFACPPDPADPVAAGGVLVITTNTGLRSADTPVTVESFIKAQRLCRAWSHLQIVTNRGPSDGGAPASA